MNLPGRPVDFRPAADSGLPSVIPTPVLKKVALLDISLLVRNDNQWSRTQAVRRLPLRRGAIDIGHKSSMHALGPCFIRALSTQPEKYFDQLQILFPGQLWLLQAFLSLRSCSIVWHGYAFDVKVANSNGTRVSIISCLNSPSNLTQCRRVLCPCTDLGYERNIIIPT